MNDSKDHKAVAEPPLDCRVMRGMGHRTDYRTKEGREAEVLAQVTRHGGFSVFWVTENQNRAHAAMRLEKRGDILNCGGAFPWCAYTVHNVRVNPRAKGARSAAFASRC